MHGLDRDRRDGMQASTFPWQRCGEELAAFVDAPGLELSSNRRAFVSAGVRVEPPLVFPVPEGCTSVADYLAALPERPGRHLVLLLQAGTSSLGLFEAGEERATKSFKRYVVRGKGRAQPTHLATKGKSRYGSRLRLQNARKLLEETNAKAAEWLADFGELDHVYYSAPVRLWADLFRVRPAPPFARREDERNREQPPSLEPIRIPRDVPKPTTEVLLRTYKALCHGRIELA